MKSLPCVNVPTFGAIVSRHASERPEAVALRFGERSWTYAAFDSYANRVANALLRDHLPGERIAYLGRNHDAIPLLALALSRSGLIFVPLNWRLAPPEMAHILMDSGAALLIVAEGFETPITGVATIAVDRLFDQQWLGEEVEPTTIIAPTNTALIIYTSGTTGLPKGVMLSHRSLFGTSTLRGVESIAWDNWGTDDVTLVPVPLAHIGGFGMLARTLFFGGEVVVQPSFNTGDVLHAIEHQRISKLGLVPTALKMVIDHPRSRAVDYARIRTIVYGAAPITTELLREAIAVFGCEFAQSYGMTETSGTCVALPPQDHAVTPTPRMRSAGRALPGTVIRIVDSIGEPLPTGEVGEIVVRCISMMSGYWNMPEETAQVLDTNGWYRTGDAGYLDKDDYLFIKDRVKDMIVSGAENVYPAEVENALAGHPDIAEVAVIGVPDPHWGEAVKAIIVPIDGHLIDAASVIAWARCRIADFKTPKSIDVVERLPHTASGKIQKAELRKAYWTGNDRQVN